MATGSVILDTLTAISPLIVAASSVVIVISNRHRRDAIRQEREQKRQDEAEQRKLDEQRKEDRRLIDKHDRMLEFLKWSGYFRRTTGEPGDHFDGSDSN